MKLFDYQTRSIQHIGQAIKEGHKRICLQLPTGSGKTVLAGAIMRGAVGKGNLPWFVVTRQTLIDQTCGSLRKFYGLDPGVIQADHPDTNPVADCQVASIQTVRCRRGFQLPRVIIIDECHEVHKAHMDLIDQCQDSIIIGLSATPWAKGLGRIYSKLIIGATPLELMEMDRLVRTEVFAPYVPDMSGIEKRRGDYVTGQVSTFMQQKAIIGNVIHHWHEHCLGKRTFLFAADVAQSKEYVARFCEAGVTAAHIDAYTDRGDRKDLLKAFEDGQIDVLSSVGVLTTGVDVPAAEVAILAAPTLSEIKHHQSIGRVLRSFTGKKKCIIMDHAGNTIRLAEQGKFALPEHITFRELDCSERKEKDDESEAAGESGQEQQIMYPCNACGFMSDKPWKVCPKCGAERAKISERIETDHKLVKQGESKEIEITDDKKIEFFRKMLGHTTASKTAKGDPRKRAYAMTAEKFNGDMPKVPWEATPLTPDLEQKKWAKYCQIKRAKRWQKFNSK